MDTEFIDKIIDKVRPCDIKSSGFTKSLGLILGELNEKQLLDQKIKLLTHLTNPT